MTDTVGFVRKLPHQLVEAFRTTLASVRLADLLVHVVDGTAENAESQMAAVRTVLEEIGAADVPELVVVNKADRAPLRPRRWPIGWTGRCCSRPAPARGSTSSCGWWAIACAGSDRVVELVVPWARGDVLAAVHREGEVVGQTDSEEFATLQVVLDEVGKARFAEFVSSGMTGSSEVAGRPFKLPPYPYDRVAALGKLADGLPGGMVDCSVGTPCDPPPPGVIEALSSSGSERGYPASAGSPALSGRRGLAGAALRARLRPGLLGGGLRGHQGTGGLGAPDAPAASARS